LEKAGAFIIASSLGFTMMSASGKLSKSKWKVKDEKN
jgi:hypothetical protein